MEAQKKAHSTFNHVQGINMYTEEKTIDQIIIEPEFGTVLWRETTKILKDGVEVAKTYHRGSAMLDDPTAVPVDVLPYQAVVDTPARRAKLAAKKDEAKVK